MLFVSIAALLRQVCRLWVQLGWEAAGAHGLGVVLAQWQMLCSAYGHTQLFHIEVTGSAPE